VTEYLSVLVLVLTTPLREYSTKSQRLLLGKGYLYVIEIKPNEYGYLKESIVKLKELLFK
jgi:hypothetical protein